MREKTDSLCGGGNTETRNSFFCFPEGLEVFIGGVTVWIRMALIGSYI